MKVAVVGGGIAGLAAAWELRGRAEVTVFEPANLGGRIRTDLFEGRPVDCGPDAFITRVPDAVRLSAELGIEDLVAPQAGRTLLWWEGRLRSLPDGLVLGAPRRLTPLVTSGLLSPLGLIRAGADLIRPRRALTGDVTVRALIAERFGTEVADRLVDPLVGSIHAGRTEALSAEATVPQLVSAARSSRSLLLGLRRMAGASSAGPLFLAPREGLSRLVDRLTGELARAGVVFVTSCVEGLQRDGAAWRTVPTGEQFDGVVISIASREAARLLGPTAPAGLSRIEAASVVLVTLGYPSIDLPPGVNGVLVPARAGWLMTACSFGSAKWPHWANPGRTVLRVSAGRDGDNRPQELDDDALVERLSGEVATALQTTAGPDSVRVSRYPHSFPQYRVGHPDLVQSISEELRRHFPGVAVCGASYHGAGIPACIGSGRSAARYLLEPRDRPTP